MFVRTIIFFIIFAIGVISSQNVYVNTSRGRVVGYHFDQGNDKSKLYYGQADIFLDLPYVQPPIGPLRFAYPKRLNKFPNYPNTYNATYDRWACPQPLLPDILYNEDCLFLSIMTPNASSTTPYPVMVYIHGGGLIGGYNLLDINGTVRNLVSRGVVLVGIQYRLGYLGFFTTRTDDFPPNLGMLDQVEALRFIQEEISNFGGNPNLVTIFGLSAGGISASAHTYSPLSQNLFHHSISESGVILTCFKGSLGPSDRNIRFAQDACNFTADQWNSGNFSQLKSCLMNLDIKIGINYTFSNIQLPVPNGNELCWDIVQDNYFLPDVPRNLAKKRMEKPAMMGTSKDEWSTWEAMMLQSNVTQLTSYTKNYVEEYLAIRYANYFGNKSQTIIQLLESAYLGPNVLDNDNVSWLKFLINVNTAFFFSSQTSKESELHLWNNNLNVYLYEFTYTNNFPEFNVYPYNSIGYYPDPHVPEAIFLEFATDTWLHNNYTQADLDLANFIGESWTNFAKYGTPNNTWTPTTTTGLTTMQYYDMGNSPGMKSGYRVLDRTIMNRVLPIFVGVLPPKMPINITETINSTTSTQNLQTTTSSGQTGCFKNSIFMLFVISLFIYTII